MAGNFHESFAQGEIKPPPARSTGLLFVVVVGIVGWLWRHSPVVLWACVFLGAALLAASLLRPALLGPLNLLWFRFSLLLHRIVNPVVMFVIFAAVFVPGGILMRLWNNPLRPRRTPASPTYWIDRVDKEPGSSMVNQF